MKSQLLLLSLITLISGNLAADEQSPSPPLNLEIQEQAAPPAELPVADDQPAPAPETVDPAGDQTAPAPEFDDRFYQKKSRDTAADGQSARCKQLRQRIAELKGKPQRRHAAVQRYDQECRSGSRTHDQRPGSGGPLY